MFEKEVPRSHLRSQLSWFLLWAFTFFMGAFVLHPDPIGHGTHTQIGLPPCPMVSMFHRPCPGCGLTTSWTSILHGNLPAAFEANLAGPILFAVFTFSAFMSLYGYIKNMKFRTDTKLVNLGLGVLILSFLAYGVWRATTTYYPTPYSVATQVIK